MNEDYYQKIAEIIEKDKASRPAPEPPRQFNLPTSRIRRWLLLSLVSLVVALATVYVGDYLIFRVRKNPIGHVTVQVYYAIGLKNGKTDLEFQEPQPVNCANALFPHAGMTACWWLRQHPEQRIDFFQKR